MPLQIREEVPADAPSIEAVTVAAFLHAPPEYFQALHLGTTTPRGSVTYHSAFEATS